MHAPIRCAALAASMLVASATVAPAMAASVMAVEYYHVPSDNSANPAETYRIDTSGWEWYRTGLRYRISDAPGDGRVPVCRYYTAAFGSQPTHFYSASAAECNAVAANADWTYEGIAFYVPVPDSLGRCGAGNAPIYRLYNNGRNGSPNHAYTPYASQREALRKSGFVEEGIAFCVPTTSEEEAKARTALLAGSRWSFSFSFDA